MSVERRRMWRVGDTIGALPYISASSDPLCRPQPGIVSRDTREPPRQMIVVEKPPFFVCPGGSVQVHREHHRAVRVDGSYQAEARPRGHSRDLRDVVRAGFDAAFWEADRKSTGLNSSR